MRANPPSLAAPEVSDPPASGAPDTELRRWRTLACAAFALLAQSQQARASAVEQHSVDLANQRATHAHDLLRDRENFLDLVAHELKTPVAVVKAYAELLEAQAADHPLPPGMREVIGHILEQTDVMSDLIEVVLDVQRLRLGKLPLEVGRLDLEQLTQAVAADVQQLSPTHRVRVTALNSLPLLHADRRRLRQVLVNLLENAVKYSAGGDIEVQLSTGAWNGRPSALLSIRDQGVGIEPRNLGRIFDAFQQVSETPVRGHVGLGLGLYVARQIARAHRGDVWAESPGHGRGSTFYLALPLDFDPEAPETAW